MSSFLLGAPSTLETGLLHSWSLEGNSLDALGTGSGTDTAVTYTTPKLGSACAAFNGSTSKIVTAVSGPLGAAAWSVSTWLWRHAAASQIMGFGWGSGAGTSVYLLVDATNAYLHNGAVYTPAKAFSTGTWHHVVCTYDGTTANLYLDNGTPATNVMAFNSSASPIILGNYPPQTLPWNGLIDDAVMWDRALDATEVASLYNSGAGLETMSGTLLTGLIHQWHLNGNSTDNVGSANGTDTAITYGGKLGQAAMFNGTASKIVTAVSGPLGAAPRSISVWFNQTSAANKFIHCYGTSSSLAAFGLYINAGNMYIYMAGSDWTFAAAPSYNNWHHCVVTYDGTNVRAWLDGVAYGPTAKALNTITSMSFAFGVGLYTPYNYFNGLIDEPAMWSRALTPAEVAYLYANGSPGRCPW